VPAPKASGQGISIVVRCFSHVRDALGCGELALELPAGARAEDARRAIVARAPDRLERLPLRIAVNHAFVSADHALADGDELALIPPVQGG